MVRLYKIDSPIADWHSWRQADTAAVARSFYQEGFNPLLPRYNDMSAVAENPQPNPQRFRLVEFPFYNSIVYLVYVFNGGVDEKLARLVSSLFSLGSLIFVFLLAKKYFGIYIALLSVLLYAILPFNVFFSRTILPEPSLVFFSLGMLFFLDLWIQKNTLNLYFLGLIFTALAFLTKPMAIFYLLPLIYSYYKQEKKFWPIPKRYFYLLIAFIPFFAWRFWISQHPEGIPASNWLFNGTGIRFRPAFWKWIIGDRFGREILGVAGTFLFLIGLLIKPTLNQGWLLHLLSFSSLGYLIVFATGNVQHDYYQYMIMPALVIFVSRGFALLFQGIPGFLPRILTIPLAILFLILTIYLTWNEVKGLYQINNPIIVEAGREADKILPKEAVVIANYNGDTSFLYQTNRNGFPNVPYPTKDLIDRYSVSHYISTTLDAKTKWIMRKYKVIVDRGSYVIVNLKEENPGFDATYDKEPN